jgi:hypothetical protein
MDHSRRRLLRLGVTAVSGLVGFAPAAAKLSERLGKSFYVENMPGASGKKALSRHSQTWNIPAQP